MSSRKRRYDSYENSYDNHYQKRRRYSKRRNDNYSYRDYYSRKYNDYYYRPYRKDRYYYDKKYRRDDSYTKRDKRDDKDGHYNFELGESLTDRYKILAFMGEGTFARVVECWDRKEKQYVAIKIVRAVEKYIEAAEIEIDILNDLKKFDAKDENYCIRLISSFMFKGHMCLVFPKYGLSLYDFIRKNNYVGFKLQHVKEISYKLLKAVAFMHSIQLIHTDLKPENILFTNSEYYVEGRDYRVPKYTDIRVIDFGSATYDYQHHTSIISTRHYRAPEVILGLGWSYPADIWSVGCIIVELFTGDAMFQTHENKEHLAMMERILGTLPVEMTLNAHKSAQKYFTEDGKLNWPKIASSEKSIDAVRKLEKLEDLCQANKDHQHQQFYDLVRKLLKFNPKERLSAKDALEHPFFK